MGWLVYRALASIAREIGKVIWDLVAPAAVSQKQFRSPALTLIDHRI